MTAHSQFIQVLTTVLKKEPVALPSEEALLHQPEGEVSGERFFYRNFSGCRLPANLYGRDGRRQVRNIVLDTIDGFPERLRMPEQTASGCAFVIENETLFFLYDRVERWSDVPAQIAFVAVRLDPDLIVRVTGAGEGTRLTRSEYLLLAHLLTGLDLKAAAARLGASYDTKRKQSQVLLDKLGEKTQTALLRNLSLELTAGILDEILPLQERNPETVLVKQQFGANVIVNTISIGDGLEVPVWEFGARRGRPVLYFHSMLAPVAFDQEMIDMLKRHNLRWLVVPRHFLDFDEGGSVQRRLNTLTKALAETIDYLSDEPLICVAESAGVSWAAHFTRQNPHLVSRLVLAATPQSFHTVEQDHNPSLFVEMSQRLRRDERVIVGLTQIYNAISRVPVLAQKGLAHMYRKSAADSTCLRALFQSTQLADWLRLIANHATLASVDEIANLQRNWLADVRQVACQLTFVHGAEDPISPIQDIRTIARSLPAATFHTIENAGHMVLTQHFTTLVKQVIAEDNPARPLS